MRGNRSSVCSSSWTSFWDPRALGVKESPREKGELEMKASL